MRHAYLILAHGDFELLQLLVSALDHERNDIYIHVDSKVELLPQLTVARSGLYLLEERVDVRWGSVRMLEAEFALWRAAVARGPYGYYHLLSGADLPLRSPDEIDAFFEVHKGQEFIGYSQYDYSKEVERKILRYHLYSDHFKGRGILFKTRRVVRALFMRFQELVGWRRHRGINFKKGTQWVSITHDLVLYLLSKEEETIRMYQHTFCCDEVMVQTWAWNEPRFRVAIFDAYDEGHGCMRYINWRDNQLPDFIIDDLPALQATSALWARKFSSNDKELVEAVLSLSRNASGNVGGVDNNG